MTVTKKEIQEAVNTFKFDPKGGPIQVILDVGNPEYYRIRALEALSKNELQLAGQLIVVATILAKRKITSGSPQLHD